MKTFNEMRVALNEMRLTDPLVNRAMTVADMEGFSDSERYLTLAYYAMQDLQTLRVELLNVSQHRPAAPISVEAKNFHTPHR